MLFLALSHLLLCVLHFPLTQGQTITRWQITQYNIEILTVSVDSYGTDYYTYTDTTTIRLYPPVPSSVIPTARATSSSVSSDDYYVAVYTTLYIPATAVPSAQLSDIQSYVSSSSALGSEDTTTVFIVDKTYTAPSTCSRSFEITTTTNVFVPPGAETQLPTPTNTTTSLGAAYTYVTAFLASDVVVPTRTVTTPDFIESYYLSSCSSPHSYPTHTYGPFSGGDSYSGGDSSSGENCLGSLCPFWLIYIVVIIPFLALLFLGGLIESYYWFSRFMKGQFAFRGVPLLWVAISLWTLLCLRRKRPAEQQHRPQLEKQWREMSSETHISLWLKYGFRHSDPPEFTKIVGNQPPVAPVWGPYAPQQQQPYFGPPGQGPPMQQTQQSYQQQQPYYGPAGQGPPMQQTYQNYQQPQPWQQGQSPPPGWTNYPVPGHQYPQYGYMNTPPAQQPGQDRSVVANTASTSAEVVPSAPTTPAPAPAVSPVSGHSGQQHARPSVAEAPEHGEPIVTTVHPKT